MSVIASFQKNAVVVSQLGSGPRLVGQIGLFVQFSDSFHILSCALVRVVVRSGFTDTLVICLSRGMMTVWCD